MSDPDLPKPPRTVPVTTEWLNENRRKQAAYAHKRAIGLAAFEGRSPPENPFVEPPAVKPGRKKPPKNPRQTTLDL